MLNSLPAVAARPQSCRWLGAVAGLAVGLATALPAKAQETIKVGILHSLSGTMAISETTLKDVMLMLIEEQNKKGGVLGRKLEAVVVDPASNWPPFGHSDWQSIVAEIKKFGSAGKKTAVVSTINGDANVPFYKELGNAGIKAKDIPVVAFSVGEEELAGVDTKPLIGHLAAWNYFQSVKNPTNEAFIKTWQAFTKNPKRVTNDPMEAHVIGFNMWIEAVKKAGTTDPDAVIDAILGVSVPNLSGGYSAMMPNHHITKPVLIGEIQGNGQFDTVWQTSGLLVANEWSPYLPDSKDLIADWRKPMNCGNFNVVTGKCGGKGK